jgi:ATP-dependent Clp protease ATP-binding subunit ClpC
LQIFDEGHLTDAKGRRVDFRNTIIIMTSNVGSDLIRKETALGFGGKRESAKTEEAQYEKMKEKVLNEMKNVFRPEFLNRIDQTLVFHALTKDHIRQIVDLMLKDVGKQLVAKGVEFQVTDAAKDWLGEKGYDEVFGARPLRRVIQNEIEDRLSEALLEGRFAEGEKIEIDVGGDEIMIRNLSRKEEEPELAATPE